MKKGVIVNNRLSPQRRPGRDILLRSIGYSSGQIIRRDLARYYSLLETTLRGLRGRFSERELEALARALEGLANMELPDSLYHPRETVEDAVWRGSLCALAGLEDCERFLQQLRELDPASYCALLDAVERYLALPLERREKEGWREVGLL